MKYFIVALFVALGLSSCCSPCRKSSPVIGDLENATWMLIEFRLNPVENSPISMHFNAAEKMVAGNAPCNNFFAGYTLTDDSRRNISFSNVGSTMKTCPDMELEQAFTRALPGVTRVKIEGDYLMMSDSLDNLVAVLEKAKM